MKRNSRHNQKKQEITLMTLLANEATSDSRKLLKEYNKPDATNSIDLEVKLAELYFNQSDKLKIERQLAEIHPHKKWLVRSLDLVEKSKQDEEVPKEIKVEDTKIKESCYVERCNDRNCLIHGNNPLTQFSNLTGTNNTPIAQEREKSSSMQYIGMIGAIGLIGLTFIIVSKNLK